jgi:putative Ca2+/H+ antiporter (TMEM165/GDT1 family)
MEALFNSFYLVAIAEIGDKTQLLSICLAARFNKFFPIVFGILFATLLNHALAAMFGSFLAEHISSLYIKVIPAILFIIIGFWLLVPDKMQLDNSEPKYGAFITSLIAFFIAEMGDKTHFATITLGAEYNQTFLVILGTTLGMLAANIPAIIFGEKILKLVPLNIVRIIASLAFIIFGVCGLVL